MVYRVFNDGVLVCEDFCVVAAGCDHGDLWTISPSANATRLREDRRTGLDAWLVLDTGNSMVYIYYIIYIAIYKIYSDGLLECRRILPTHGFAVSLGNVSAKSAHTHNAHMPADHSLFDRCCEGSGSKVPGRQATTDRRRCWVAERVSWNDHMTMSRDDMVSFA